MHKNSTSFLLVFLTYLFGINVFAANITVTTDRDPVALSESFQLIFESDGSVDGDPDFSPLQKSLQILSTSASTNMSIINGKITNSKRWQLTVLARHAGKLAIPSIHFGNDKSSPSVITVNRVSSGNRTQTNNREIFIEVEANPLRPYVQSQIVYKIRLFRAIATANASLSDPELSGSSAIIERLDEDKGYETTRSGKRYGVVERTYVLYPQASGDIHIAPIVFQGQTSPRSSFFSFDPFGPQSKSIVVQSEPVTLNVSPVPDAFTGSYWLPAEKLTLTEDWSENPPIFNTGQPVTRTLTLTAKGLTASQLPELPQWNTVAFKQYPDQPSLTNDKSASGIVATRGEKIAIIPTQAGKYVLPEIKIPWWNTVTDTLEYVRLPEKMIDVTASQSISRQNNADSIPFSLDNINVAEMDQDNIDDSQASGSSTLLPDTLVQQPQSRLWQWISLLLGIGWIITLFMWWMARNKGEKSLVQQKKQESLRQTVKILKKACREDNAIGAKNALLQWGKLMWTDDPPTNIGDVGRRSNENLAREIHTLNKALYSNKKEEWQGGQFWQAFVEDFNVQKKTSEMQAGNLEPLYKI